MSTTVTQLDKQLQAKVDKELDKAITSIMEIFDEIGEETSKTTWVYVPNGTSTADLKSEDSQMIKKDELARYLKRTMEHTYFEILLSIRTAELLKKLEVLD